MFKMVIMILLCSPNAFAGYIKFNTNDNINLDINSKLIFSLLNNDSNC